MGDYTVVHEGRIKEKYSVNCPKCGFPYSSDLHYQGRGKRLDEFFNEHNDLIKTYRFVSRDKYVLENKGCDWLLD